MWVWGDSRSRYWFLGLSLLGGWISRECAGCALPFSWPARLVCSLGMPAGVRGEDTGMSGVGRWGGGGLWDPHEVWTRRKGGCSCYSVVELWMTLRTGSGWRKKVENICPSIVRAAYLVFWKARLVVEQWVSTQVGDWEEVPGRGKSVGCGLWNPQKVYGGGCSWCSAGVLGMALRILSRRTESYFEILIWDFFFVFWGFFSL